MAKIVAKVLQEYKITDRLYAVTTDNAKNNNTLRKELKEIVCKKYSHYWDHHAFHISCMAHVIQLVVKAFLNKLSISSDSEMVELDVDDEQIQSISSNITFSNTIKKVCNIQYSNA